MNIPVPEPLPVVPITVPSPDETPLPDEAPPPVSDPAEPRQLPPVREPGNHPPAQAEWPAAAMPPPAAR